MKRFFQVDTYLPIINGLIGDKLAEKNDSWAIAMNFRIDGKDVRVHELDRKLRGKKILLFLHGLMADEKKWKSFDALKKEHTVLHVRYNSGLHISTNGRALSDLLNRLDSVLSPKRVNLIGHSMGGLVIRSACHYATLEMHAWVKKVSAIFLIAVPNAGAPLEKLGHLTASALNRIARWHLGTIGNLIEQRSNGIKDLRLGWMLDEEWQNSAAPTATQRTSVLPLPGVQYHILVGSLSKDEKSMMAKCFGDGLVTPNSAVAKTLLRVSTVKVFPGSGHNSILDNPFVIRYVSDVLTRSQ